MKLLFKQRFFSWFDSYDIYNEAGQTVYTVKGQLAWGHSLKIYDAQGREIGTVKERILTFLLKFEMYLLYGRGLELKYGRDFETAACLLSKRCDA